MVLGEEVVEQWGKLPSFLPLLADRAFLALVDFLTLLIGTFLALLAGGDSFLTPVLSILTSDVTLLDRVTREVSFGTFVALVDFLTLLIGTFPLLAGGESFLTPTL